MKQLNGSIVLYHNNVEDVTKVINSFFDCNLDGYLYLIDNSRTDNLQVLSKLNKRIIYTFNKNNIGYGSAHNIGIRKSIQSNVSYHVVLNPDLFFDINVLPELYNYMENNVDIGNIMPRVLYPDGKPQNLCKLLPTPINWFGRFILNYVNLDFLRRKNDIFEMKSINKNKIMNVPYLSGCFMFLRTKTLIKSGLFDENIFLHTEDTDLSRRIYSVSRNVYYPELYIYHEHNRESYRNLKVMLLQIKSMFYYFNKWGWFFDKERDFINNNIIKNNIKNKEL